MSAYRKLFFASAGASPSIGHCLVKSLTTLILWVLVGLSPALAQSDTPIEYSSDPDIESMLIGLDWLFDEVNSPDRIQRASRIEFPRDFRKTDKDAALKVEQAFVDALNAENKPGVFEILKQWNLEVAPNQKRLARTYSLTYKKDSSADYQLYRASAFGDLNYVNKLLLEQGANPNVIYEYKQRRYTTALVIAIDKDYTSIVERLLEGGADPHFNHSRNTYPLKKAIENGNGSIARALLDSGATLNQGYGSAGMRAPVFMKIVKENNVELLKALLDNGAKYVETKGGQWTALLQALFEGHTEIANLLLNRSNTTTYAGLDIFSLFTTNVSQYPNPPKSNALSLARLGRIENAEEFEQKLLERTKNIGGELAVLQLEVQSAIAESQWLFSQNENQVSREVLVKAINAFSDDVIENSWNEPLVSDFVDLLLNYQEHSILLGEGIPAGIPELRQKLFPMPQGKEKIFDMLEAVASATDTPAVGIIEDWESVHKDCPTRIWDYTRLNSWAREMADEEQRANVFYAIDYFAFEVTGSVQ